MDLTTAVEDTLDPRPLKKVTSYALGTLLEGMAVGLVLTVFLPYMSAVTRCVLAAICFVCGAVFAVSAYSDLKRNYRILPHPQPPAVPSRRAREVRPAAVPRAMPREKAAG